MRLTRTPGAILAASTAAILLATLRPDFSREALPWSACILCGGRATADAIVNLILFTPLGVGLALANIRPWPAIAVGALFSILVELAQTVIPGRDPSLSDVVANTLGTAAGVVAPVLTHRARRLSPVGAARLSLAAAGVFATVIALTGGLLRPSYPRAAYYGQWTPLMGHLEWYGGHVESASIDGVSIRPGPIENSDTVRALLIRAAPIAVSAVAGSAPPALSSLLSIYDEYQREIMLLGPDRDDLVYRRWTAAAFLGFDQPDLRVVGALRGLNPGDSLHIVVWSPRAGRVCLGRDRHVACDLGFSVGAGWTLLYYVEHLPRIFRGTLDTLWLVILVAPIGYCLRRRVESALALGFTGVTLWWLPGLVGLKPAGVVPSLAVLGAMALIYHWGRRSSDAVAPPRLA